MAATSIRKCPYCGKVLLTRTREDSNELVLKIRFLKFREGGGSVLVKCRHCGQLIKTPFLRVN